MACANATLTRGVGALPSAALPILVYHQIRVSGADPSDGPTAISLERFRSQMRYLHDAGYTTLKMDEVVRFLHGETFPGKSVAIHIDDGWKSGLQAVPVLEKYGLSASFCIIAGAGIGWPHMDWDEVQQIAANPHFDVCSHTMTHPWKPNETLLDWLSGRTPGKDLEAVRWELVESRRVLEAKVGHPVPYLAWPSGYYDGALIRLAREAGYTALLTIDDGLNVPGEDPLRIHRTLVNGGCDDEVFREVLADGKIRACDRSS
jgi:peptidoglycan/xylan/chitin deacetylase (PgdA/CDA1 family)